MTKLAVLVCIFLVAIVDHAAPVGPLGIKLRKFKWIADTAIKRAEGDLATSRGTTDRLTREAREKVDTFIREMQKQVTDAVDMVNNKTLEIIAAAANSTNATACAERVAPLNTTAEDKIANVSRCANEELAKMNEFTQYIYNTTGGILFKIKQLKADLEECTAGVYGPKENMKAIFCAKQITAKVGFFTLKRIPEIPPYVIKLGDFVKTLNRSLPLCAVTNGISTFVENADRILIEVQDCVLSLVPTTAAPPPTIKPSGMMRRDMMDH